MSWVGQDGQVIILLQWWDIKCGCPWERAWPWKKALQLRHFLKVWQLKATSQLSKQGPTSPLLKRDLDMRVTCSKSVPSFYMAVLLYILLFLSQMIFPLPLNPFLGHVLQELASQGSFCWSNFLSHHPQCQVYLPNKLPGWLNALMIPYDIFTCFCVNCISLFGCYNRIP